MSALISLKVESDSDSDKEHQSDSSDSSDSDTDSNSSTNESSNFNTSLMEVLNNLRDLNREVTKSFSLANSKVVDYFNEVSKKTAYSQKFSEDLSLAVEHLTTREENSLDSATYLSLTKAFDEKDYSRYDTFGQRHFFDENGKINSTWDAVFICEYYESMEPNIRSNANNNYNESNSYSNSGSNSKTNDSNNKANMNVSPYKAKGKREQVLYLVAIEHDMTQIKLQDISKRLAATLKLINSEDDIDDDIPWQIKSKIYNQRSLKMCMIEVIVGGENIDTTLKNFVLSRGYSCCYLNHGIHETILQ